MELLGEFIFAAVCSYIVFVAAFSGSTHLFVRMIVIGIGIGIVLTINVTIPSCQPLVNPFEQLGGH